MVFLQPSSSESAFIFSTSDGSDAIVLDIKGVYTLIDGGTEPLQFMNSLRAPTAAIVSSASPGGLVNAIEMNKQPDALVAVVGNLPSSAALKEAAAAAPLRELYKTLSLPPVVAQLKGAKPEPIVIHKNLSSGTLSVYTLAGDAKDAEAVAKAYQSGSSEAIEAAAAAGSSVLLIVWQPVREDAPIKRILHLGSAPLPRIQQALDRARALPFLQSATPTAASLKAKPAAAAGGAARPAARVAPSAAPTAAKPAARVAPAARSSAAAAAPTARASSAARSAAAPPTAAVAPKPSRATMAPSRPAPASSSAARPARASVPANSRPAATAAAAPAARGSARGAPTKEEVAKKTIVSKSAAAPSSTRSSAASTPAGVASRTPAKGAPTASARGTPAAAKTAAAAAGAAVAAVAATTVVAAAATSAASDPTPPTSPTVQHDDAAAATAAAPAAAVHPSISVSIDEPSDDLSSTPGGLPVPASPTIIPATPQPPMSPEPQEEEHVVSSPEPVPAAVAAGAAEKEEEKAAADAAAVEPSAPPLVEQPSVDEPEFVKQLVDEEPQPQRPADLPVQPVQPPAPGPVAAPDLDALLTPTPDTDNTGLDDEDDLLAPTPEDDDDEAAAAAAAPAAPTPDDDVAAAAAPAAPTPDDDERDAAAPAGGDAVGDLIGGFDDQPVQPQQPGDDGLLDSIEEPMKKMKISMDTDKLAEELGLTGEQQSGAAAADESLLDLTQESVEERDLDKTQHNSSVIESAHEFDDLLSPRGAAAAEDAEEMQRKLSQAAEENLLTTAADPFIAGLASTVVEAATIDGAKSTLESLMSNNKGVESPTGEKLLSFRSSGYENPDQPKEVKYEETDPEIDNVLAELARESEKVNGTPPLVDQNGHGDSTLASAAPPNGHALPSHDDHEGHGDLDHLNNGPGLGGHDGHGHGLVDLTDGHGGNNGWPEGTTMHLPPPGKGGDKAAAKFKLAGPVHVDLVAVPHRGKQILLADEAASLEFFSSVRSSLYLLQTGGDVPTHVLDGWKRGKGAWAVNVPSRLIPTHHNETVARWVADHQDELAEINLSVATSIDLTTLTFPDGQAKACTVTL